MRGPRRQQHELVGKQKRFSRIVRHHHRRGGSRGPHVEQEASQAVGRAFVERHERFVQQKQVRLGREGPRQGGAASKAERKLLRVARQHLRHPHGLGEIFEIVAGKSRRGDQLDILPNGPPGKQARLLKHEAQPRMGRHVDLAGEVVVEPRDHSQQRGLAASRRPHQHGHAFGLQVEGQVTDRRQPGAVGPDMGLLLDADFKRACCASALCIVQGAAPVDIRSRA